MKYELNKNDWLKLSERVKDINNKNENDKYYIELKAKNRSYNQLQLYWGAWLPAILYFLKDDIKLNDTEELHIYLKEYYCYKNNKTEYYKLIDKILYQVVFAIFHISMIISLVFFVYLS